MTEVLVVYSQSVAELTDQQPFLPNPRAHYQPTDS